MSINKAGTCVECGFHGIVVVLRSREMCPICIVEFTEALAALNNKRVTHTAVLIGQQFYLRGGQSLKDALAGLKEKL